MSGRDEAPRLKKWFLINGITSILFWVSLWGLERGQGIIGQTVLKFVLYLAIILWINSCFYLSKSAMEVEVESWEFQKEQVKLTLWIIGVFIVAEVPIWLIVLSNP